MKFDDYDLVTSKLKSWSRQHGKILPQFLESLHVCVYSVKKKSKTFTKEVFRYLREAPDTPEHARAKMVLLAGYYRALRCDDLVPLKWADLEVEAEVGVWCKLISRKTGLVQDGHTFLIQASNSDPRVCGIKLFEQYRLLLKQPISGRVVMSIRHDKFTDCPLGKNFVRLIPKFIATFLELPEAPKYTGQSLRRSSATSLVDAGCSRQNLKRHGGWKSDSVAEGYLSNSKKMRTEVAQMLSEQESALRNACASATKRITAQSPSFSFSCSNCTNVTLT